MRFAEVTGLVEQVDGNPLPAPSWTSALPQLLDSLNRNYLTGASVGSVSRQATSAAWEGDAATVERSFGRRRQAVRLRPPKSLTSFSNKKVGLPTPEKR